MRIEKWLKKCTQLVHPNGEQDHNTQSIAASRGQHAAHQRRKKRQENFLCDFLVFLYASVLSGLCFGFSLCNYPACTNYASIVENARSQKR